VNTRDLPGHDDAQGFSPFPSRSSPLPLNEAYRAAVDSPRETLFEASNPLEFPPLTSSPPVTMATSGEFVAHHELAALRKRLFAPAWWCEGLLVKHGGKDALAQQLASSVPGRLVVVGPAVAPKQLALLWAIWNDLVAVCTAGKGERALVRLPLGKHLRGTAAAISETVRFLETYWSNPFQVVVPRTAGGSGPSLRKSRQGATAKSVSVNFVRYCAVEFAAVPSGAGPTASTGVGANCDSPELVIELTLPLIDFLAGRFEAVLPGFFCDEAFAAKGRNLAHGDPGLVARGVVSANPDVLRAFGSGASFRKVIAYIFVEFAKRHAEEVFDAAGWQGKGLRGRELEGLHEGLLQRTKALYDHGVFGWDNAAPQGRVRELRGNGTVVHCWRLSVQARQAAQAEALMREHFVPRRLEGARAAGAPRLAVSMTEARRAVRSSAMSSSRSGGLGDLVALHRGERDAGEVAAAIAKACKGDSQPAESVENPLSAAHRAPPLVLPVLPVLPVSELSAPFSTPIADVAFVSVVPEPSPTPWPPSEPPLAVSGPLGLPLGTTTEDEQLLMCVLEYYSSLSARQQRLFQTQRARMSDDEFRAYVLPLLKRRPG
jgi:hypothetical protein